MRLLHRMILDSLDRDIELLEIAESEGLRGNGAQLLIDKYTVLRNLIDEYRNRAISAGGLKVEFKQRLLQLQKDASDPC